MKWKKTKLLAGLLAAVLCMAAFSMPAFASGDDWCEYGDYGTPETTAKATPTETPAASAAPGPSAAPTQTATPSTTTSPSTTATPTPTDTAEAYESSDNTGDMPVMDISDLLEDSDFSDLFNALLSGAFSEGGEALTPDGNLTIIDDIYQMDGASDEDAEREEKQFITVQSKNGNYFYLVIDRSGDEENVYFLNLVDEADLLALTEDESADADEEPVCICTDKCVVGDINTACPVCQTAMSECTGKETEPEATDEPEAEPEQEETKSGNSAVLLIVLVLALAGGGAVYYFKFRKPKADTKGPVDLDDYDFGDEEDGEDRDYEFEPDDDEPEERNEGD